MKLLFNTTAMVRGTTICLAPQPALHVTQCQCATRCPLFFAVFLSQGSPTSTCVSSVMVASCLHGHSCHPTHSFTPLVSSLFLQPEAPLKLLSALHDSIARLVEQLGKLKEAAGNAACGCGKGEVSRISKPNVRAYWTSPSLTKLVKSVRHRRPHIQWDGSKGNTSPMSEILHVTGEGNAACASGKWEGGTTTFMCGKGGGGIAACMCGKGGGC